jgi:hypothetical protein
MKIKFFSAVLIIAVVMLGLNVGPAFAGAYSTAFTTSITYQNVGTLATTQLEVWFYDSPTDPAPTIVPRTNLNPGAGTSLYIGGLSEITQGFRGTAILVSDQPLVATLVQLPQGSDTVKNRPLSNGFSSGTEDSLIATILKNAFGGWYTILSVQNVGNADADVDIEFYDTSATLKHVIEQNIKPGAGLFVDTGLVSELGSSFNGSAVIKSYGGQIVSSAMELADGSGTGASAFEGFGSGAKKFYMPSALCNYQVTGGLTNTSYAVQNTSQSTTTDVTVTFSDGSFTIKTIGPGAKGSFSACDGGVGSGFLGSAIVESTTTDVIAMGKAYGAGLSTAFGGSKGGTSKVALPYVRWATGTNYWNGFQQRVYIAIQNVGGGTIGANQITVEYIDRDGNVVGTHIISDSLAPEKKANSNATDAGLSEFGVYANGTQFGGGVIITGPSGSQLAAIARVSSYVPATGLQAGEDYNGIDTP